jgi:hypothetical protein
MFCKVMGSNLIFSKYKMDMVLMEPVVTIKFQVMYELDVQL